MQAAHVRTKERVANHGEVLTGHREVNAMLDLVKQEKRKADSSLRKVIRGARNALRSE